QYPGTCGRIPESEFGWHVCRIGDGTPPGCGRTTDSRRVDPTRLGRGEIGARIRGREDQDPVGCVDRHCLGFQPVGRHGDGWTPALLDTRAFPAAPHAGSDGGAAGPAIPGRTAGGVSVQHGLLRVAATYA